MVKICFHSNQLCERGAEIALFDYAYYNIHILKNQSIILYENNNVNNNINVINKFKKHFTVYSYKEWNEVDKILLDEKCDILYMIKGGHNDNKIANPSICKTVIHCVFNCNYPHGDVYGKISSIIPGDYPIVGHIVTLPVVSGDYRELLNIPKDANVFGRIGGLNEFNIPYVHKVIDNITDKYDNMYFIFVNTAKFCKDKKNIIHLDKIVDTEEKVKFINTCDAMIHGRSMGETFGLSIAEFSIKNKPVITTRGKDNAHLDILGDKMIFYYNYPSLYKKLVNFNKKTILLKNWNAYEKFSPENIMQDFYNVFIKPLGY